jgi:hypothetical protein
MADKGLRVSLDVTISGLARRNQISRMDGR